VPTKRRYEIRFGHRKLVKTITFTKSKGEAFSVATLRLKQAFDEWVVPQMEAAIRRIVDIHYENYEGLDRATISEYIALNSLPLSKLLRRELAGFEPKHT
jgi:hypothetical protein